MDLSVTDFNLRLRSIRLREVLVAAIIAFVLMVILSIFIPIIDENDDLMFIIFLFFILIFFVWSLRGTSGIKDDFSKIFDRENSREILYVLIINFIFALFIISFFVTLDSLLNPVAESVVEIMDDTAVVNELSIILEIVSSLFFAPILEELFFRGVLFNRLKIRTGLVIAMIASSILFAIGHEFGGIIGAFLFGMCMCVIYHKTDNILLPMAIHFLNNFFATLFDFTPLSYILIEMPWVIITLIISTISGVLILVYIFKNIKTFRAIGN